MLGGDHLQIPQGRPNASGQRHPALPVRDTTLMSGSSGGVVLTRPTTVAEGWKANWSLFDVGEPNQNYRQNGGGEGNQRRRKGHGI